jgi:two-component system chemotaxis response regulator CheY
MTASMRTLMIVDDSLVIRNRILRVAKDPRMPAVDVVGMARDGEEALSIAARHNPDLVTMDLTMPNMDGAACIEKLAAMLPEARILVISALSDKATALKAMKKGAHGFIHKPFGDDSLISAFGELVR